MSDEIREVSREEAQKMVDEGAQLVDVRADHEWEMGRIEGATHLPLAELAERTEEIDKDRPVVFYCRGGNRSTMAAEALAAAGYEAAKLSEGIVGWSEAGLPLAPEGGAVAESGEAASILHARKKLPPELTKP
jgi:rhodanese-related sulfurtransferase